MENIFRMKNYLLILIIINLLCPALTNATTHDSNKKWYLSWSIGSSLSANGDTHIPSINSKPPLKSEFVYNGGNFLGLTVGYRINPFRIEGEFAYQNLPTNKLNDAIDVGSVTIVEHSYTNLYTIFLNGFYDFKFANSSLPYPYVGFGTGYVYVKNMIKPNPPIPVTSTEFFTKKEINYPTWGYQGVVGILYQVQNNFLINLNYKYFSTVNHKVTGQTNLGPDGYRTQQRIINNIISLGLQYYFI
jgi:opacity protein-like surface antigen